MKLLGRIAHRFFSFYVKKICRQEYQNQRFEGLNERPVEYRFVFQHLSQKCPVHVLDIGTGATALPHLMRICGFVVTATDNGRDYWPHGLLNRHFYILDDDITATKLKQQFVAVKDPSIDLAIAHIKT